jgi:hypothetical protein
MAATAWAADDQAASESSDETVPFVDPSSTSDTSAELPEGKEAIMPRTGLSASAAIRAFGWAENIGSLGLLSVFGLICTAAVGGMVGFGYCALWLFNVLDRLTTPSQPDLMGARMDAIRSGAYRGSQR